MPRIPFIEVRFFDPTESRHALEQRFQLHLQKLREARQDEAYDLSEILGPDPESICSNPRVGTEDVRKISRRTKRLLERRDAACGLAHLKADDRERLQTLRDGVELIRIPNEHRADELAAELHAGMPWLSLEVCEANRVTPVALSSVSNVAEASRSGVRFRRLSALSSSATIHRAPTSTSAALVSATSEVPRIATNRSCSASVRSVIVGLAPLPTFMAYDVMKNPEIDGDLRRFDDHLARQFQ